MDRRTKALYISALVIAFDRLLPLMDSHWGSGLLAVVALLFLWPLARWKSWWILPLGFVWGWLLGIAWDGGLKGFANMTPAWFDYGVFFAGIIFLVWMSLIRRRPVGSEPFHGQ